MGNEMKRKLERISWWIVDILSLALEPSERIAVRGDLVDCGDSSVRSITGVFGLVIRRQIGLWKNWRPWLALVGLSLVSGVVLSEILAGFNLAFFHWINGFSNYRTANQDILYLASLAFALITFSSLSGFVLAALSGRTLWFTAGVFYFIVLDAFWLVHGNVRAAPGIPIALFILYRIVPFHSIGTALFILPGCCGLVRGLRQRTLPLHFIVGVGALILMVATFLTWTSGFYENARAADSNGMYSPHLWYVRLWPLIVVSWPMIYLFASTFRTQRFGE